MPAYSYTYDALNRVTSETSVGVAHNYRYDLNGNRTNAVYGVTDREVSWAYNAMNQVTNMIESSTNSTRFYYDLNGRITHKWLPSGKLEYRKSDALGRVTDIWLYNVGQLCHWIYEYDAVGSALHMYEAQSVKGFKKEVFWEYDGRYRLTNEVINTLVPNFQTQTMDTNAIFEAAYEWDAADNRRAMVIHTNGVLKADVIYTNNALNQITSWHDSVANKDVVYHYDDNGKRRHKYDGQTSTYYYYDEDNRLTTAVYNSSTPVVNEFKYDYRSRRYYRATSTETNLCVFDGGLSVQEYAVPQASSLPSSGTLTTEYLRGPDLGGGVGGMVYSIRNGTRTYAHSNHRGDVIARSLDDGSLTWYTVYEAYGTRADEWGSNPDRQKANTKEEDTSIGLLNEGMRYRDLETGTFLTRDPIGYADGPNVYCYVHCNPITHFDPLGLKIACLDVDGSIKPFSWGLVGRHLKHTFGRSKAGWNDGVDDVKNIVAHPLQTAKNVGVAAKNTAVKAWNDPIGLLDDADQSWADFAEDPFYNISRGAPAEIVTFGVMKFGSKLTRFVPHGNSSISFVAKEISEEMIDVTTELLEKHKTTAIEMFNERGLSAKQKAALVDHPNLEAAFRGSEIDRYFKELVENDPALSHVEVTPRFKYGPDVYDPTSQKWWDVTTEKQWDKHVKKYEEDFGSDATPLLTDED